MAREIREIPLTTERLLAEQGPVDLLIGHLNLELIGHTAFIIRRCEQY
jgi:hypothetical protein